MRQYHWSDPISIPPFILYFNIFIHLYFIISQIDCQAVYPWKLECLVTAPLSIWLAIFLTWCIRIFLRHLYKEHKTTKRSDDSITIKGNFITTINLTMKKASGEREKDSTTKIKCTIRKLINRKGRKVYFFVAKYESSNGKKYTHRNMPSK